MIKITHSSPYLPAGDYLTYPEPDQRLIEAAIQVVAEGSGIRLYVVNDEAYLGPCRYSQRLQLTERVDDYVYGGA